MTTAQTLITDAFIESRVTDAVDTANTTQSNLGLRFLNRIIARASTRNFLIPFSITENFDTVAAQEYYTMGSAGTASATRAKKITNAYITDQSDMDHVLRSLSEENYNAIEDKTLSELPFAYFYDPVYPVGVLHLQPIPDAVYTVYIESQKDMHSTLALDTTVSLPAEYEEALVLTLAAKLARAYGAPTEGSLLADASDAWRSIIGLNASQRVPQASLPFQKGHATDIFNINNAFTYTFDFILA